MREYSFDMRMRQFGQLVRASQVRNEMYSHIRRIFQFLLGEFRLGYGDFNAPELCMNT